MLLNLLLLLCIVTRAFRQSCLETVFCPFLQQTSSEFHFQSTKPNATDCVFGTFGITESKENCAPHQYRNVFEASCLSAYSHQPRIEMRPELSGRVVRHFVTNEGVSMSLARFTIPDQRPYFSPCVNCCQIVNVHSGWVSALQMIFLSDEWGESRIYKQISTLIKSSAPCQEVGSFLLVFAPW